MYYRDHYTRSYIRCDWYIFAKLYKNNVKADKKTSTQSNQK